MTITSHLRHKVLLRFVTDIAWYFTYMLKGKTDSYFVAIVLLALASCVPMASIWILVTEWSPPAIPDYPAFDPAPGAVACLLLLIAWYFAVPERLYKTQQYDEQRARRAWRSVIVVYSIIFGFGILPVVLPQVVY